MWTHAKLPPGIRPVLMVALLGAAACENPESGTAPDPTPESIRIQGPEYIIQNDTAAFTAAVLDGRGAALADAAVEWATSDTTVATVSPWGSVTGVRVGSVELTARAGPLSASLDIAVGPAAVHGIYGLELPDTMWARESVPLFGWARDAGGQLIRGVDVEITSSDPAIASVDDWRLEAHRPGETVLAVRAGDYAASFPLTVLRPEPRPYDALVEILTVNGQAPRAGDPVVVSEPQLVVRARVSVPQSSEPPDLAVFELSQDGLVWSGLELDVGPGGSAEFTLVATGRVLGEIEMRVAVINWEEEAPARSEPVRVRSSTPFVDVHIVEINGTPVRPDGVTRVADRFEAVLEVHVPEGAPDTLQRFWLEAELDEFDPVAEFFWSTRLWLGVSQEEDFALGPGTHRVVMTAHAAPAGRYTLYPVAVLWPERVRMNPIQVEVTNSDRSPPEVTLVSPSASVVVSMDDPEIILDLEDEHSGVNGVQILMDWSIGSLGPCMHTRWGLSNGAEEPLRRIGYGYQPSECFGKRLLPGENPFVVTAIDNAVNLRSIAFTLIYDPAAATAGNTIVVEPETGTLRVLRPAADNAADWITRTRDRNRTRLNVEGVLETTRRLQPKESPTTR